MPATTTDYKHTKRFTDTAPMPPTLPPSASTHLTTPAVPQRRKGHHHQNHQPTSSSTPFSFQVPRKPAPCKKLLKLLSPPTKFSSLLKFAALLASSTKLTIMAKSGYNSAYSHQHGFRLKQNIFWKLAFDNGDTSSRVRLRRQADDVVTTEESVAVATLSDLEATTMVAPSPTIPETVPETTVSSVAVLQTSQTLPTQTTHSDKIVR